MVSACPLHAGRDQLCSSHALSSHPCSGSPHLGTACPCADCVTSIRRLCWSSLCLQDETSGFAQLTARVRARHLFAAYDGKGKLVAGQPDKEFPVQVRVCLAVLHAQ